MDPIAKAKWDQAQAALHCKLVRLRDQMDHAVLMEAAATSAVNKTLQRRRLREVSDTLGGMLDDFGCRRQPRAPVAVEQRLLASDRDQQAWDDHRRGMLTAIAHRSSAIGALNHQMGELRDQATRAAQSSDKALLDRLTADMNTVGDRLSVLTKNILELGDHVDDQDYPVPADGVVGGKVDGTVLRRPMGDFSPAVTVPAEAGPAPDLLMASRRPAERIRPAAGHGAEVGGLMTSDEQFRLRERQRRQVDAYGQLNRQFMELLESSIEARLRGDRATVEKLRPTIDRLRVRVAQSGQVLTELLPPGMGSRMGLDGTVSLGEGKRSGWRNVTGRILGLRR